MTLRFSLLILLTAAVVGYPIFNDNSTKGEQP